MPTLEDRLATLGDHINDELDATVDADTPVVARRRAGRLVALAAAAVVVLGGVGLAAVTLTDRGPAAAPATSPPSSLHSTSPSTSTEATRPATSDPASVPPTTSTPRDTAPIAGELRKGSTGADVQRLQQRLTSLGFQPGPIDGQFGDLTQMAVWAYQKLVDDVPYADADGVVTAELWTHMQHAAPITPRRPGIGRHIEIDLPSQTLSVFDDDVAVFITHISSGAPAQAGDFTTGTEWCEEVTTDPGEIGNENGSSPRIEGICGVSRTPGGVYSVYRKVEGLRSTRLGGMTDPIFFNYSIAVHGAYNLPLEPASHGAVRIPNQLAPTLFHQVAIDDPVYVFDGIAEPETYGAQTPLLDRTDHP